MSVRDEWPQFVLRASALMLVLLGVAWLSSNVIRDALVQRIDFALKNRYAKITEAPLVKAGIKPSAFAVILQEKCKAASRCDCATAVFRVKAEQAETCRLLFEGRRDLGVESVKADPVSGEVSVEYSRPCGPE